MHGTGLTMSEQRTLPQNSSLHLWLTNLAVELNDAGLSLGDGKLVKLPVLFTQNNLKENIVRPMMTALYPDKTSTTQLDTKEIQYLYQHLDHIIAERTGVHCEWPDRFGQMRDAG